MSKDKNLDFLNALTLAELATLETTSGVSFDKLDKANPLQLMPALAILAAQRLGIEESKETLSGLTMDELQELFSAASSHTPTRPDEIHKILETVRGKSQPSSSKR